MAAILCCLLHSTATSRKPLHTPALRRLPSKLLFPDQPLPILLFNRPNASSSAPHPHPISRRATPMRDTFSRAFDRRACSSPPRQLPEHFVTLPLAFEAPLPRPAAADSSVQSSEWIIARSDSSSASDLLISRWTRRLVSNLRWTLALLLLLQALCCAADSLCANIWLIFDGGSWREKGRLSGHFVTSGKRMPLLRIGARSQRSCGGLNTRLLLAWLLRRISFCWPRSPNRFHFEPKETRPT